MILLNAQSPILLGLNTVLTIIMLYRVKRHHSMYKLNASLFPPPPPKILVLILVKISSRKLLLDSTPCQSSNHFATVNPNR